jgi:hypothetical protein
MVKKYAVIVNNVVVNAVLWDSEAHPEWRPDSGSLIECGDLYFDIGWTWDGSTFNSPS